MRVLVPILLASVLVGCSLFGRSTVKFEGISMQPGIKDSDRLTILEFNHDAELELKRGDIVLFRYPNDPEMMYIKRLVGLPGETIEIREGRVFVNGTELPEPYVDPKLNEMRESSPSLYVKPHYYYVLGDNRDNSSDSRMWGLLPERYLVGKVLER